MGSHEGEYVEAGVDFHHRGQLMDAGIAALRAAWDRADDAEVRYRQLPTTPRIPIWLGGSSEAARKRAAAVGDGWVPLFLTPDDYGAGAGRAAPGDRWRPDAPAGAVEPGVVVFARVGRPDEAMEQGCRWLSELYGIPARAFEKYLIAGPSEACAAGLARFVRAGARHIVVMVAAPNAVTHFGYLRSAFVAHAETALSGVPA